MSIEPRHERFDPAVIVRDALREAVAHRVELARDADYRGHETVTVVQVPLYRQAGSLPGARWLYEVQVVLSTTGPDFDSAWQGAYDAHEGLLSQTDYGGVLFSSVRAENEPVQQASHVPTGAVSLVSTIRLFLRRSNVQR